MNGKTVIYVNNMKLPRLGKGEFSKQLVTNELCKKASSISSIKMEWKEFLFIWKLICNEIIKEVCSNPLGVKLAFFTGEFKVQYLPYKMDTVDIPISTQIGEVVPQLYMHSKGKVGTLVWERKAARKFNRLLDLYGFEAHQENFRDLVSAALRKNPEMFRVSKPRLINRNSKK